MPALPKDMVAIAVKTGASARAEVKKPPRFDAGDKVVARNINPATRPGCHVSPRQAWRGAAEPWRFRLCRYPCAWAWRPAAIRLQRSLRGARAMGRRCPSA